MITATIAENRFVLDAPSLMKDLVRQIPGVRWHRQTNTWRAPLSWSTALAARSVLGDRLELAPSAIEWGAAEACRVAQSGLLKASTWPDHPFGFQDVGTAWLAYVERGILGDEPGLGKTRQAILAATYPCLVISTNSTKYNWKKEFEKWRPGTDVCVLDGSAVKRSKQLAEQHDCWIVNWESIRTLSRLSPYGSIALSEKEKTLGPLNRPWSTVIADEVHAAKDPTSKQTRAYWAIMSSAHRRFGLSGTVAPESPENVWSIMHGLAPEEYPSRVQFIDRYTTTITTFWGGLEILGLNPATKDEFFGFFDPRYLRRTKAEALPQLPEKIYSTRYLTMDPKQRKVYDEIEHRFLASVDGGTLIATGDLPQHTRLLQAANGTPTLDDSGNVGLTAPSNKVNALLDLISESPNEPLVVFTPSRKLLDLAGKSLCKAKISFTTISGGQAPSDRQMAIDDFQSGAVQVILCTTSAGGVGITLHRASRLVFLSRPEKAVESVQAEDRIHRIGQANSVEIIDLVSLDTIEHDLHENLGHKGDLAQEIQRDPTYIRRMIQNRQSSSLA